LTGRKEFDRLFPVLVELHRAAPVDMLLAPLRKGALVILRVNDPRLPKRRRITGEPRLFLQPFDGNLLVALEGHGAEVVNPYKLKSISFSRLGINATLSEALAENIKSFFTEGEVT
jgi:hypothetical protein